MLPPCVTLAEVGRRLGCPGQYPLLRYLCRQVGVTPTYASATWLVPEAVLPKLEAELRRWKNRPRATARV